MSKPFNIHDWQAKQKQLSEIRAQDVPGTAAWRGRAGLTVGGSYDTSDDTLRDEVSKYIGQTFASWMSPDNPPFAQEYAKSPYIDKLVDGIMDIVDRGNLDEMNTTGGGASFNAGSGEGYMTPKAFKKKNKED